MKNRLVTSIQAKLPEYEKTILEAIDTFVYQKERYKVEYTMAIGASVADVDMLAFEGLIRKTDGFICLEENLCVIVFAFNNQGQGIKAASNMLNKFEMQYFGKDIYLGIINSEEEAKAEKQIKKLFETLCYGIINGMSNTPLDYEEISSHKTMA